jgi:hypothetical protein
MNQKFFKKSTKRECNTVKNIDMQQLDAEPAAGAGMY